MNKLVVLLMAASLAACAAAPPPGVSKTQAEFDQACKYAAGAISAAQPVLPVVQALLLAKFGQDMSLGFGALISTVQTACNAPLDLTNAAAITQRVYDIGGQIVGLVVKSQQTPPPATSALPASSPFGSP